MSDTYTYTLASGDEFAVPASLAPSEHEAHPRFLGVTSEGHAVVESYGLRYRLTPCCTASGKGSADSPTGVVCRSCFAVVGSEFGMDDPLIDDPVAEDPQGIDVEALAEVLNAARAEVARLRMVAAEIQRDTPKGAEKFTIRASILADAIDRVQATR